MIIPMYGEIEHVPKHQSESLEPTLHPVMIPDLKKKQQLGNGHSTNPGLVRCISLLGIMCRRPHMALGTPHYDEWQH